MSLEGIKENIESRMQDVEHCFEAKTLPGIHQSHLEKAPSMGYYGKMQTRIWEPESSIKNELFDKNKALQPMCLQYLDAPFVHTQTDLGYDFVNRFESAKTLRFST